MSADPNHPSSRALALPAELAAEIAALPDSQSFAQRVEAINRGLRTKYQGRLMGLSAHMSDALRLRIGTELGRLCDAAIIELTVVDSKGWSGGSPITV